MQLNSAFISNIRDLYGEKGVSWINDLPSQLMLLSAKWNIYFLEVMPNLSYHFVGLAKLRSTGEFAIIKIAPENKNISTEAKWLQCFTEGVPKVYWYDEEQYALLMEYLTPGNSLKNFVRTGNDDLATRIICRTILDLQTHQQKLIKLPHLSELGKTLSLLKGQLDSKLLSQAESWFRDLTNDRAGDVILHGDLHHDNVLSSGSTWKVIDPHGYIGDSAFEVGAMIYNPFDCFPNDRSISQIVERRLKILFEELPFDAQRIKAWTFCRTILSIGWTFEDHKKIPEFELQIASAIDKIQI